jgi:hypothetical protein
MAIALVGCSVGASSGVSGASTAASSGYNTGIAQPEGPTVETNLITGLPLDEGMSVGQRPVAIMINNARAALPQRGVASADAIFEMVTEGGITRLMALYANAAAVPQVGPVRSARDQHLQFAMPLNAIFVHIGSSIYAANLLNEYTYQDIDGMYLGTTSFWFDSERSKTRLNEHCWYTDASLLTAGIQKQQIATTGANTPLFNFIDPLKEAILPTDGTAADIVFNFSSDNQVRLTYDANTGLYYKQAYGEPHVDELTGEQLAFANAVLLFTDITLKPDGQCTNFDTTQGTGYYCYGGQYQEIIWQKGNPEDPLKLLDKNGSELEVNVGKSYIAVVGNDQLETLNLNASPATTEAQEAP